MTTSVKNDHSETTTATQPELLPQITVHPEDLRGKIQVEDILPGIDSPQIA